jgi:hypothetical protein
MLLHTHALPAFVVAVLAFCAVATPTGPSPHSAGEPMLGDSNAAAYLSPPSPPHVAKPYSHSDDKVKLEGISYVPSSHKPYPEKHKPEEKPYGLPASPLSLLPSPPSKEKPKPYEKDHPSAPPPKFYPEKPMSEEKPHSPAPPPKSYPEKPKAEGKPYAVKEDKPKFDDNYKSNEKPHVQAPKKEGVVNGCDAGAGKCRRADAVSCVYVFFRSFVSNRPLDELRSRGGAILKDC